MQGLILVSEDHGIPPFPNIPKESDNHGVSDLVVELRFPDIAEMNVGFMTDSKRGDLLLEHLNRGTLEKHVKRGFRLLTEWAVVIVAQPFPKPSLISLKPLPGGEPEEQPTFVWGIVLLPNNPCKRKVRPASKNILIC
jgi:hypothetical protein